MIRLIAEASCNHGGSLSRAIEMAEIAKWAGADTVKYQRVSPEGVPAPARDYYRRVAFTQEQWRTLKHEVESLGLRFLCTPQTVEDFKALLELGIDEVKVSSDNGNNLTLWKEIDGSGIHVICSNGMSDAGPEAFDRPDTIFMVCTSEYPCSPESVRLLSKMRQIYEGDIWGFSDHTIGSTAAILAMGMGARVFEKHFLPNASSELDIPEKEWACVPIELKFYFQDLKLAWTMLGEGLPAVTEAEKKLREELGLG